MNYMVRLRSAAAWYERQQAELGQEFLNEFVKILKALAETPLIYAAVYRKTHRAILSRFPLRIQWPISKPTF